MTVREKVSKGPNEQNVLCLHFSTQEGCWKSNQLLEIWLILLHISVSHDQYPVLGHEKIVWNPLIKKKHEGNGQTLCFVLTFATACSQMQGSCRSRYFNKFRPNLFTVFLWEAGNIRSLNTDTNNSFNPPVTQSFLSNLPSPTCRPRAHSTNSVWIPREQRRMKGNSLRNPTGQVQCWICGCGFNSQLWHIKNSHISSTSLLSALGPICLQPPPSK